MNKALSTLIALLLALALVFVRTAPASASARTSLQILKKDNNGTALFGATFTIPPNPKTATGSLVVVDNGANDASSTKGVLLVTRCLISTDRVYQVCETVAPAGYDPAPCQNTTLPSTTRVTLTFVNTQEGSLEILKQDDCGDPLSGSAFNTTPNPKTGTGSLDVVDNGSYDEDTHPGVLLVTGCLISATQEYIVCET